MTLVTDYEYQGPKRGTDRAVLLAHGAGSDRHGAVLVAVARALAAAKVPSLRFDYPYRSAGKKAPDRPALLERATREAVEELGRRTRLPPERLVLGGRSMGGRYCSLVAGDAGDPVAALGLLLLGYPLHAPGKPDRPRSEHFARLPMPVLFVSGTRDALAERKGLTTAVRRVKGPATLHWLDSADHGFRPLKSSGHTLEEYVDEVARVSVAWVRTLPG